MRKQEKNNGFTIIEVVLVLAIAGLIFLMVFIALPALQRSQRDTARKNDASTVAAAVTSYTSNNKGAFPTNANIQTYVTNLSSNSTTVKVDTGSGGGTVNVGDGQIIVHKGATCGATGAAGSVTGTAPQTVTTGTARQFVVVTRLESGNYTSYCLDS